MSGFTEVPTTMHDGLRFIEQEFVHAVSRSFSTLIGEHVKAASVKPSYASPITLLWFMLEFEPLHDAPLLIGAKSAECVAAERTLEAVAGLEKPDDETALSILSELWAEVAGSLASSFTTLFKHETTARPVQRIVDLPSDVSTNQLSAFEVKLPGNDPLVLNLIAHPNLLRAMTPAEETSSSLCSTIGAGAKNLDLLLDVEMPVSVSFGRAQLPLKDVIKLTTGSIVELSRSVSEPVDIIVNNCVIARGEVVVVEGNFGVRIKEISSKQDRLRSLS